MNPLTSGAGPAARGADRFPPHRVTATTQAAADDVSRPCNSTKGARA